MNEVSDNKPGTSQGMDVLFFLTGKETLNWILFYYPRNIFAVIIYTLPTTKIIWENIKGCI